MRAGRKSKGEFDKDKGFKDSPVLIEVQLKKGWMRGN